METLALVTGASRGFGYATARALAEPDTHILALARTTGGLEELDTEIKAAGGTATLVPLDVTDEGGLQRLGKAIHDRWGKLDVFVHAAAHAPPLSPVGHIAEKDLDKTWEVNARATQRLVTMLDPVLKAAPGSKAVLIDDKTKAEKFFATYRASKLAARSIWESWAAECTRTGPTVTCFRPNPMPTALRARFYPGEDTSALADPAVEAQRLVQTLRA